jgi:cardiolipin synthase
VGSLALKGLLPAWLAALVIGRDAALVGGMFLLRARQLGWRWPGAAEFFKAEGSAWRGAPGIPPAARMRPSAVSKVNTALQLAFVGGCIGQAMQGWPGDGALGALGAAVVATTAASGLGYLRQHVGRGGGGK